MQQPLQTYVCQGIRFSFALVLMSVCAFSMWSSSSKERFGHCLEDTASKSWLSSFSGVVCEWNGRLLFVAFDDKVARRPLAPEELHSLSIISVVFVGVSFLAGATIHFLMTSFISQVDIMRLSQSPKRLKQMFHAVLFILGSLALPLICYELGFLSSAVQFWWASIFVSYNGSSSISQNSLPDKQWVEKNSLQWSDLQLDTSVNLRSKLFFCALSTILQSCLLVNLLWSLSILLDLHSAWPGESNGTLLLIDEGQAQAFVCSIKSSPYSSLSEDHSDIQISLSQPFSRVFTNDCAMCGKEISQGDVVFGCCPSESDKASADCIDQLECCHTSCVASHCILGTVPLCGPPSWLPVDVLDGRTLFVWVYVVLLVAVAQMSLIITKGLKSFSQAIVPDRYSKATIGKREPLLFSV